MKIAKQPDWKTEPLPDNHITIGLNLTYSKYDQQKIIAGIIPKQIDDKWFVYFDKEILSFHRSSTGFCIFRVHTRDDSDLFILTHAEVNRDQEQYEVLNEELDRQMISNLIDILLLQKEACFPLNNSDEDDILKTWSSIGKSIFSVKSGKNIATDFVRIIPTQRYVGFPTLSHRPYAFYADAGSLQGRTIAECYSLVNGLNLPPMESGIKHCSPNFLHDYEYGDYDIPIADIKIKKNKSITFEDLPLKKMEQMKFVILRISRSDAIQELDVFPATWKALSYIVSDPIRMGARSAGWDMNLSEYASASIHALFKKVQAGNDEGLLALKESKDSLRLNDLDRLPSKNEELIYYSYLSRDSVFTNKIVKLFGISSRCWHGCGYLGPPGKPICRFFLLRNKITPNIKVSIMSGKNVFQ